LGLFNNLQLAFTMSSPEKQAGQSTRDMADKRYKTRVWFVLLMLGAALFILVLIFNSKALGIGGFGFLGLLILYRLVIDFTEVKAKKMKKAERRAVRGAKAEKKIGSILAQLGPGYQVIHDVTSPYGNIDHIVISQQNGIFLIETKAHGGIVSVVEGRLLVNGHEPEKDFIAQALKNTYWLREKIGLVLPAEVWITPLVVFTNAFVERTAPVKGVAIINKKYLSNALARPKAKAEAATVWENRERILDALSTPK
jgi:hypothetical protein